MLVSWDKFTGKPGGLFKMANSIKCIKTLMRPPKSIESTPDKRPLGPGGRRRINQRGGALEIKGTE